MTDTEPEKTEHPPMDEIYVITEGESHGADNAIEAYRHEDAAYNRGRELSGTGPEEEIKDWRQFEAIFKNRGKLWKIWEVRLQ